MIKQKLMSCLINENMIPKQRSLFSHIDITPSEFFDIYQESDHVHELDGMTKDEWFDDLRRHGVDVDELEKQSEFDNK